MTVVESIGNRPRASESDFGRLAVTLNDHQAVEYARELQQSFRSSETAYEFLNQYLQKNPTTSPKCWVQLIELNRRSPITEKVAVAVNDAQRAALQCPAVLKKTNYYIYFAEALIHLRRPSEAIELLNTTAQRNGINQSKESLYDTPHFLITLAKAYRENNQSEKAIITLKQAITICPKSPMIPIYWFVLAQAHTDIGQPHQAITILKEDALKYFQNEHQEKLYSNAFYWIVLADALIENLQACEAIQLLQQALTEFCPKLYEDRLFYKIQGKALIAANKPREAISVLREGGGIGQSCSSDLEYAQLLADAYADCKEYEQAFATIHQTQQESHPKYWNAIAGILMKKGKYQEATETLLTAATSCCLTLIKDPQCIATLSKAYIQLGDTESAFQALNSLYPTDTNRNIDYWLTVLQTNYANKNYEKVLKATVSTYCPSIIRHPVYWKTMIRSLIALQRKGEAANYINHIAPRECPRLQRDPEYQQIRASINN